MPPQISVIVPVHNAADSLDRCVRSVLDQSLQNVEVILVDDGSTDSSPAMCDRFSQLDRRVMTLHRENGGVSAARNDGLRRSSGKFVAFLDADDWAESVMLEEMLSSIERSGSDVLIAGCVVDSEDQNDQLLSRRRITLGCEQIFPSDTPPVLSADLINLVGYSWNKLYRRTLLDDSQVEFPQDMSLYEDLVFCSAALCSAGRTIIVDRAYVHYIQRPRSSLGTVFLPDFLEGRLRALEALSDVLEHWGLNGGQTDARLAALRVSALRSLARRTSEHSTWALHQRIRHFKTARRQIDGLVRAADLSSKGRLEFGALRHTPAVAVVIAFVARGRFVRSEGTR